MRRRREKIDWLPHSTSVIWLRTILISGVFHFYGALTLLFHYICLIALVSHCLHTYTGSYSIQNRELTRSAILKLKNEEERGAHAISTESIWDSVFQLRKCTVETEQGDNNVWMYCGWHPEGRNWKKIDIFEENISLFFYYNYFMAFHIPRCPSFHKSLNAH